LKGETVRKEIKVEIIGNCKNISDTNIKGDFCIVKAESCLYDDDMARSWLKPQKYDYMFRLLDDDKCTYFLGYSKNHPEGNHADVVFEPLDEYGINYGCTEIQYKINGKWTTI
jgi:hypothetical protein